MMTSISKFPNLPDLTYQRLKSGWYRVAETIQVSTGVRGRRAESGLLSLDAMGLLTIREGFEFDGASGPAIDTTSIMYAACIHDALYSLIEVGSLAREARQSADLEFMWLIRMYAAHKRTPGVWAFLIYCLRIVRSMWCYAAVRMFGGIWLRPGKGRGAKMIKRIAMGAMFFLMSSCQERPPRDPSQETCRAAAVALAELEASGKCKGLEWEACPHAEQIESDLMRDLKECDE